jgi:GTPase SAR1 family protein
MRPTLMKYNPAFLSREELIRSFVVRHLDLELIIETIKENTGNSNQHVLIIGPRGMGKTMLVLRTGGNQSDRVQAVVDLWLISTKEKSWQRSWQNLPKMPAVLNRKSGEITREPGENPDLR